MLSNKKILAEELKLKLNSPDYLTMPDLISYDDRHKDILLWKIGSSRKNHWISGNGINFNWLNCKHKSKNIVTYDELEPSDWEEIVSLIEKRNREREEIYDQKKELIKQ